MDEQNKKQTNLYLLLPASIVPLSGSHNQLVHVWSGALPCSTHGQMNQIVSAPYLEKK